MPKIRHLAIASQDPEKTAEFFKQAFEFKEMRKIEGALATGVFLSDGTLNLAVLKFKSDQIGKGMDYTGLHHFGVLVDDADAFTAKLEAMGADCFLRPPEGVRHGQFEVKFRGPEGIVFDIAEHPWMGSAALDEAEAREKAEAAE
jgi:catechol 2,3-dioxygenase-like lactoylglutathione lyase family enzyme